MAKQSIFFTKNRTDRTTQGDKTHAPTIHVGRKTTKKKTQLKTQRAGSPYTDPYVSLAERPPPWLLVFIRKAGDKPPQRVSQNLESGHWCLESLNHRHANVESAPRAVTGFIYRRGLGSLQAATRMQGHVSIQFSIKDTPVCITHTRTFHHAPHDRRSRQHLPDVHVREEDGSSQLVKGQRLCAERGGDRLTFP